MIFKYKNYNFKGGGKMSDKKELAIVLADEVARLKNIIRSVIADMEDKRGLGKSTRINKIREKLESAIK